MRATLLTILISVSLIPPVPTAESSLRLPGDLSDAARSSVKGAIRAFREATSEFRPDATLEGAIRKLREATRKAPKLALPYYYLGMAYQMKKDFRQARQVLKTAVRLDPKFHEAYVELADVYVWQEDTEKSIEIYDKALSLAPDYAVGLERKSHALIRLGRYEEANSALRKAFRLEQTRERFMLLAQLQSALRGPRWEKTFVAESKNYKVSTSVSQEFADEIARHAELIRKTYEQIFPNIKRPARKYPIWVYPDKTAYHKAGGPPQAGGHYSPLFRRLVLYRYPKHQDTLMVLNHEAFHQYLHDYLEIAPQWFNEGLGDYFGPFEHGRVKGREVMLSRPNRWRLRDIRIAMRRGEYAPIPRLMLMSRAQMYRPRVAGIHYAQAWSLVYFMLEGKKGYAKYLVKYFQELRKGKDPKAAFDRTFGRLDMRKFEAEWRAFILGSRR